MEKPTIGYFTLKFPWYPLTFVYSEIMALKRHGYRIKIMTLDKRQREELHDDFQNLWDDIEVVKTGGLLRQLLCYCWFVVFYPKRMSLLRKKFRPYRVNRKRLFIDRYLLPAFPLAYHMKKIGDISYLHNHFTGRPATLAYIASQLLAVPRGFTTHADSFVKKKYHLLKEQVEDSAIVFAVTKQAMQNLNKLCAGDDEVHSSNSKMVYKPVGINLNRFEYTGDLQNTYNLISVCRFDPKKGLIYLVRACHVLFERGRQIKCVMVGSASDEYEKKAYQEVVEYIRKHKLEDLFDLPGFLPQQELLELLRKSSIFVAPYIITDSGARDGVPTGLVEAMAVGLVPVTTDAGAILELVEHGRTGIVVPQKDATAIADAIETLVNDDDLFQTLSRNARLKIECERDVEKNEQIIVKRFEQIIPLDSSGSCQPFS